MSTIAVVVTEIAPELCFTHPWPRGQFLSWLNVNLMALLGRLSDPFTLSEGHKFELLN